MTRASFQPGTYYLVGLQPTRKHFGELKGGLCFGSDGYFPVIFAALKGKSGCLDLNYNGLVCGADKLEMKRNELELSFKNGSS
ncbi:hypothetical protein TNCT_134001 [Trichonephila clavata]|uniref:Uncharacterized protein n=1 Tax=Trichonephila clavata TaxID=2740835 RepID=A0A8X6HQA2_TRICU|nr:hypothetical protein TNCT_134001 [Trichonephila clavata]